MSWLAVLLTFGAYLLVLFAISFFASRNADNATFFIGARRTSWYMATLAMIGAAMSGVTYISVPGSVLSDSFSYMQMVIGFTVGQMIVAFVLIPLFYKRGVVSLYQYLDIRYGVTAHRTGAWCFLFAKVVGASLKVWVVCEVMQLLLFDALGIGFIYNVVLTMLLVLMYTMRGGVRSLIMTDILQTIALVASVVVAIIYLCDSMGMGFAELRTAVIDSPYSQMCFFEDSSSPRYFWKMVAGGVLVLVAMTGLDQDMMQRNMSCRTIRDSQINIVLTAITQIGVILLFLLLGLLIYKYIDFSNMPMPAKADDAFALVAVHGGLPLIVGVAFVIGLMSSTYSAAGASLTSLTTSFTLDILDGKERYDDAHLKRLRQRVHITMAVVICLTVILFDSIANQSVINMLFTFAGYTYGPILGLFVFGMACKYEIKQRYLPIVVVVSPVMSYLLKFALAEQFSYHVGFELLGYNALFTIFGLMLIIKRNGNKK